MATIGSMVVKLIADAQQFERQMNMSVRTLRGMERQFERTARRLEDAGQRLTWGVTVPMGLIGGSALNTAMDAVEAQNLFEVTMGDMADEAEAFSRRLREQFGLATDAVNLQQAAFFRHFKLYGIGRDQALSMAQSLSMLTNDLASFTNKDPTEVLERLQSGLRGETDAVETLGITLADSIIKQVAYRRGLAKKGQELTEQQKQLARYLAIMEQTADAQGDLARTIDSPANQMRILRQEVKEAHKAFGKGLLPFLEAAIPVLRRMAGWLNAVAEGFQKLNPGLQEFIVWSGLLAMVAGPVTYGFGMIARGASGVMSLMGGVAKFSRNAVSSIALFRTGAATLGQTLVAIAGGKFTLFLIALGAVAVAGLLLVANWERVSAAAHRAWSGISAVILYAASLVVRGVAVIIGAFAAIMPGLRPAADAVNGWADSLKGAAGTALNAARTAATMEEAAAGTQQTAQAAEQAAGAQQNLDEAMKESAEAAAGNLQSFDQVHQLQEKMAGTPAALPQLQLPGLEIPGMAGLGSMMEDLSEQAATLGQSVADGWARFTEAVTTSWETLKAKALDTFPWLEEIVGGLSTAVQYLRDNWDTIAPAVEKAAGVLLLVGVVALAVTNPITAVVSIAGALAIAAGWVIANWETVGPTLTAIWQAILAVALPVWNALREALADIWTGIVATAIFLWDQLRAWWASWGDTVIAYLTGLWRTIGLVVETAINLIRGVVGLVLALIRGDWEAAWNYVRFIGETIWTFLVQAATILLETLVAIWESLQDNIKAAWEAIQAKTLSVWIAITSWLTETWNHIGSTAWAVWSGIWTSIHAWWDSVWFTTSGTWAVIATWLEARWEWIGETASRTWQDMAYTIGEWVESARWTVATIWSNIAAGLERIWTGIRDTAAEVWNGIIEAVKSPINAVIGLVNRFLDHLSSIRISIPEVKIPGTDIKLGGGSIGFPSIPQIPMLADGGNIVRRGAAIVGEAGAELVELPRGARVTPLSGGGADDLADAIGQAVYAAVRQALQSTTRTAGTDQEVVLQIDGQRFARMILPAITREGQRIGSPVVRIQEG
ncbi:MAG: hypothetical protein ACOY93_13570 [Bacillota bacterium]